MTKCGDTEYWAGNTYYCRTVGCPVCRWIEIGKQKRKLTRLYEEADQSKMFMVTICLAAVASLEDVSDLWNREKKALNYIVKKLRNLSRRWAGFRMNAFLEIMPFTAEEVPLGGSDQEEMLNAMGVPSPHRYADDPVWLVHIHAIGHARDLDWQEVRDALTERWSHPHQVNVEPFYDWQDKDVSIAKIVSYSLKYAPGRMLANGRRNWPLAWMSEYYQWAFGFSRGYQSFKFSIGPKRVKNASDTLKEALESMDEDEFSSSPILFTDSAGTPREQHHIVDIPTQFADPVSSYRRWEMTNWCECECTSAWGRQWLVADDLARFEFADVVDAVAFKLRFSDLFCGGP
jgi:hypothetical protein